VNSLPNASKLLLLNDFRTIPPEPESGHSLVAENKTRS
jgi:hypothetical protein